MGLFTEVRHPTLGHWVQFKTGHDRFDKWRYEVGDEVDWFVCEEAGESHLTDGAYYGEVGSYWDEAQKRTVLQNEFTFQDGFFVIVKGHKVHAVEQALLNPPEADWREPRVKGGEANQAAYWCKVHGIEPLPVSTWSDAAWAAKAKRDEESRQRLLEWAAEDFLLSPEEHVGKAFSRFMGAKMREDGFLRKIMPVEECAQ